MKKEIKLKIIKDLLNNQRFGVIATQDKNEPYTNLVAFIHSDNLKQIILATPKNTKKYDNIIQNSRMSMLIDNRGNKPNDIKNAIVVTAIGSANEIKRNTRYFIQLYLKKHPYLSDFINSKDTAIIRLKVEKYLLVNRFQNVEIIQI